MNNRAGSHRHNALGEASFTSYVPSPIAQEFELHYNDNLVGLLIGARLRLHKLDEALRTDASNGAAEKLIRFEAEESAQLASGTKRADEEDIDNLEKAIIYATARTESLPISGRLIQEAHGMALQAPGHEALWPGWFRESPAWMGNAGASLAQASFVFPVPEDMEEAMADLERFVNDDRSHLDPLVRAALAHYQFETIHPFLDGNGRAGRILNGLLLVEYGLLSQPVLPISFYFARSASRYYDKIRSVQETGDCETWVAYYLEATTQTAQLALDRIEQQSFRTGQKDGGKTTPTPTFSTPREHSQP